MSVKELETAIAQLAPDELAELTDWFDDFRAQTEKEVLLPDADTPKTVAQLAEEQRQFVSSMAGRQFVDIGLPEDDGWS